MGCLDDNLVVDFIEGGLDPAERAAAEEHLARCADCRKLIARTAEALFPTDAASDDQLLLPAPLRGLKPNDVIGRYRVLHRVGAGAMGVVYAAEDLELRRKVALKLLRVGPSQPAESLGARLRREARAASVIRHPNVVPVHDVLTLDDGSPVLVMDLLVGEPLRELLDRDGPLGIQETARIFLPVLSALEAAHALGVVHRDLKPDNIFLSKTDSGELDVKIVDFGVAKLTALEGPAARSAGLTETGALVGTPYYMSPEQAFGEKDIDTRSDLWAVGVILYECLTGQRPTEADNMGQVLKLLAHLAFPPLEEVAPDLPPRLSALVGRLLCEQEGRLSSAAEVRQELTAIAETPELATSSPKGTSSASADTMDPTSRGSLPSPNVPRRWTAALGALLAASAAAALVAFFALRSPAPTGDVTTPASPATVDAQLPAALDTTPLPAVSSLAPSVASATPASSPPVRAYRYPPRPAPSSSVDRSPPDAAPTQPLKLIMDPPF